MSENNHDLPAKLRLTLDLSYFPSKISESDLTEVMQKALSTSLADLMGVDPKSAFGVTAKTIPPLPATADEARQRYGWPEFIYMHAVAVATDSYENDKEGVISLNNDVEIRVPAFGECDYVRVTQGGFELVYWTADEWKDEPQMVMGAIMGLVIGQQTPRTPPPRVIEPNASFTSMGRN
jgi:hypothetical protein